ncbi:MAG: DUF2178 domain-containing protein [Candidatus Syntrophoarchaeum sp.]|nr:DUF2178 domain-containing protein [Candidatus Syntrophoarchaeum sp.]
MSDNRNKKRIYTIWRVTAYVIAVGSVTAGVLTSNAIIGAIGVGIGIVILISARQRYRVVTHDERTIEISRRAASAAFSVFVIGLLALYMLNRFVHPVIGAMSAEAAGDWLGILPILMLYCHLGFYTYYRWRM